MIVSGLVVLFFLKGSVDCVVIFMGLRCVFGRFFEIRIVLISFCGYVSFVFC